VHTSNRCVVSQREVGVDTKSFAEALRRALRQDPDIILVGEMRDRETIEIALRAAETGHLVFATLHTQDVAQTIDRIVDVFEGDQQEQVRSQLSTTLQAVVAQVLCRTIDGHSRVPATEVMVATPAIRSLLREGKTAQIYSTIHTGGQAGMHTLDQSLAELVKAGEITYETGAEFSRHLDEFGRLCGRSLSAAATARTTLTDPYAAYQGI
jgi:twitching motility protein PilT